jgi:hypothetical protein
MDDHKGRPYSYPYAVIFLTGFAYQCEVETPQYRAILFHAFPPSVHIPKCLIPSTLFLMSLEHQMFLSMVIL